MNATAIMDNLTYTAYEYNRGKGMSHEALADILPIDDDVADKYKEAYERSLTP